MRQNSATVTGLRQSKLAGRDLLHEVVAGLVARPGRTALTALGTILGVAALVATLGLARTAGSQIISRLNTLSATEVVVTPANQRGFGSSTQRSPLPWDAQARLERLNGVVAAGTLSDVDVSNVLVRSVPVIDPTGASAFPIPVMATDGGVFDAIGATLSTGTFFDQSHNELASSVAVLGPAAAQRLSITRVDNQPAIFIGEVPVVVIGILENVQREPGLLNAILVTDGFARARLGLNSPAEVHIETELGAAQLIGLQSIIALVPNNPELVRAQVPPDPRNLQNQVGEDVNALFLVLGGLTLLVGAIGIANVTLVSVLERTGEIGLRRALGATPAHIARQFLTESAVLGLIAGIIGTSVGVLTVVAVAGVQGWQPVLQPWLPLAAPFVGVVVGLISGAYPAMRAAAIEPVDALRSA